MDNRILAQICIEKLKEQGVQDWIVCAGARNAPLVEALGDRAKHFFDERSASFFALGRAKLLKAPVAIITTSGTAAAELLPAMVEAFYSAVPIVAVTADRPMRFRGSGAPQSIEQKDLFLPYVTTNYEFEISTKGPSHLNVHFEEPQKQPLQIPEASDNDFLDVKSPLVIVSSLAPEHRESVTAQLLNWNAPVYLESTSGLRNETALRDLTLRGGSRFLTVENFRKHFDSVVRVGRVPTVRLWRDLDLSLNDVPVISFSDLPFSGLGRVPGRAADLRAMNQLEFETVSTTALQTDAEVAHKVQSVMCDFPKSEVSLVAQLSHRIPAGSRVFLGNSLPIREWDLIADNWNKNLSYEAQRGANGIDGLLSTFLGGVDEGREHWIILGDLSTLYDLTALWAKREIPKAPIRICVINNGGGMIFRRVFGSEKFENAHRIEFSKWASMFDVQYIQMTKQLPETLPDFSVIEIQPDAEQTENFWSALES